MAKSNLKCTRKGCARYKATGRNICHFHRREQARLRDPVKYCYDQLKRNCKRRGKPITITLQYFREFCQHTEYIQNKGKTHDSFTIDCIDPDLGYIPGNIRILTNSENARKGCKKLVYDWQTGTATVKPINYLETAGHF